MPQGRNDRVVTLSLNGDFERLRGARTAGATAASFGSAPVVAEPVVVKMNLSVGLVLLIRAVAPSLICICTLYLVARAFDEPFDTHLVVLASLAAALAALLLQPARSSAAATLAAARLPIALAIFGRWLILLGILLLIGYVTKFSEEFSRRVVLSWAVVTPPLIALAALAVNELMRRVLEAPANARSAVFVGCNNASLALATRLARNSQLCIRVDGFFDDRNSERLNEETRDANRFRLLGRLENLAAFVKGRGTEIIFISLPVSHLKRVRDLLDELQDTTASIYYVPDLSGLDLIQARSGEILGVPVVAMCETPFYGYRGVVKRFTDICFSALGLLFLMPFLIAIAIAVKATSPGPALFKQRRYGLDGQPFWVYKFRTMYVTQDGDHVPQATREDERITPAGRFLRRYSLDELPQLVNVLQGRMSLVGPRPHAIAHNEMYRRLIKGYMVRHKVLPGITGLAQVCGLRGETRTVEEMEARVRCDLEYLRQWSFLLDLQILLRTAVKLIRDRNAY